jgi:ankyrin repeat protein
VQQLLTVVDALGEEERLQLVNDVDADGTSVLMAAAAAGHAEVVALLLDRGAQINAQNQDGHSALMFAHNGQSQEEALLRSYREHLVQHAPEGEEGLDGDGDGDGIVLLIEEALRGREALLALLLGRGADPGLQVSEWLAGGAVFAP